MGYLIGAGEARERRARTGALPPHPRDILTQKKRMGGGHGLRPGRSVRKSLQVWFGRGMQSYIALAAVAAVFLVWLRRRLRRRHRPIVIDGSNVMHWRDNTPKIATVAEVVVALRKRGFRPGVIFDANAGWKLEGRYRDDSDLAAQLALPAQHVVVVPKGQPADPTILAAARDLKAPIVSNDRFAEWAEAHPEVKAPGTLIRGGYRDGKLWLDLD